MKLYKLTELIWKPSSLWSRKKLEKHGFIFIDMTLIGAHKVYDAFLEESRHHGNPTTIATLDFFAYRWE